MHPEGNTVFIPGATSGIGLAFALELSARGNTVIIGGRRAAPLRALARQHPELDTVRIDTTKPASIRVAAETVLANHPDLNVLITMAGIIRAEDWHRPESFLSSAEAVLKTNVLGMVRLIAAFVEHLQTRPNATIMTVSSGLAFAPHRATPSYNASKAAVHLLTESLRLQLEDTSVEVLELQPPAVQTDVTGPPIEGCQPLGEFVSEVMHLIQTRPDATEIQPEGVKFLRHCEARGEYGQVVKLLNATPLSLP
ncbi:SDR family NAD(P)-dependent oxidoreductase [Amycolatopsis carbonis]|uniref:SDR family NAD(P)-dependent oxidoreductase n=1 Tax=Amycolatopsis carbonis TaxID=715471 RepID=A0A9Y2IN93_9PSEU|nr:SDR family NAD(P)-dependent oxidoreductase [Amycolatopsis sp. 2-15]WIX83242.1 SDR family NAD(P)-dependent oxidoreductase [Amycolatopsis sp. 2-15]